MVCLNWSYVLHPNEPSGVNEALMLGLETEAICQEMYSVSIRKLNTVDDASLYHDSLELGGVNFMSVDLSYASKGPFNS